MQKPNNESNNELNFDHYPKTDYFEVIDTIPEDHYFTLTSEHVKQANKNRNKITVKTIEELEKKTKKSSCGWKNCNKLFHEHKLNLLVAVNDNGQELQDIPGFEVFYNQAIKQAKKDNYHKLIFAKRSMIQDKLNSMKKTIN